MDPIDIFLENAKEENIRKMVAIIEDRLWDWPVKEWRPILSCMLMEDATEEIHEATRRIVAKIDGILVKTTFMF